MSKVLSVTFSDGSTWHIPAEIVARDRAFYCTNEDKYNTDTWSVECQNEYEYALSDDMELIDWAANNMNWEDLKDHAVKVSQYVVEPDYDKEWSNRALSVMEVTK